MGTWATDPFGNDIACDWTYEVEKSTGVQFIEETLEKVLSVGEDYLESPDADEAIAAADTVARLRGHFYERNAYTKSLDEWIEKQTIQVSPELVDRAIQAVDRILTEPSELLELWQESGEFGEWAAQMEALKLRLKEASTK